jgi:hypothetical protein
MVKPMASKKIMAKRTTQRAYGRGKKKAAARVVSPKKGAKLKYRVTQHAPQAPSISLDKIKEAILSTT